MTDIRYLFCRDEDVPPTVREGGNERWETRPVLRSPSSGLCHPFCVLRFPFSVFPLSGRGRPSYSPSYSPSSVFLYLHHLRISVFFVTSWLINTSDLRHPISVIRLNHLSGSFPCLFCYYPFFYRAVYVFPC